MRNQYIMNRMKTVSFIFGNGCRRSFMEACWVTKFLIVNGWEITPRIDKASLVFFYGCGFTSNSEQRSIKQLKLANRLKRKESPIIACGCLPGINKNLVSNGLCTHGIERGYIDKIDEIVASDISIKMVKEPNDLTRYQFIRKWPQRSEIDFFNKNLLSILTKIKTNDFYHFKFLLKRKWFLKNGNNNQCRLKNSFVGSSNGKEKNKNTLYHIKTSTGCMSECTYCTIKHATGPIKSKSLERITNEFREGLSKGYKKFFLVGEDVGAYGQDIGLNIVDLLKSLFKIDEKFLLEIHDFSPKWLIEYFPSLSQIMESNRDRIGFLGFPVQSGSDKILKLMNRGYSATALKDCLISLRKTLPDIKLMTHIMIGFPGEDEDDFSNTLDLLNAAKFDSVYIYRYDDRPGAKSSELNPKISNAVKNRRIYRLKSWIIEHISQTAIH